jgi:DNA-binding NtrC family response regulator
MDRSLKQRILKSLEVQDWSTLNQQFPVEVTWDIITETSQRLGKTILNRDIVNHLYRQLQYAKIEENQTKIRKIILELKKEAEKNQGIINEYLERFKSLNVDSENRGNIWDTDSLGVLSYEFDN